MSKSLVKREELVPVLASQNYLEAIRQRAKIDLAEQGITAQSVGGTAAF